MAKTERKKQVAVVGAGTMGVGIAQVAASAGHRVSLFDTDAEALERAGRALEKALGRLVEKGRLDEAQARGIADRVVPVEALKAVSGSEIVIEAVVEDLRIKNELFANLESIVDPSAILATNTSSLSIASVASACSKPERVVGVHFFNPAPLMQLVEIIPGISTSDEAAAAARALVDAWGKTTVTAKDTPGFIVNRVARPFYGESLRIFEEGVADFPTIDWAMKKFGGFRMGPFELMDFIGNDVNYTVTQTVFEAFFNDPRYRPSFAQKRLVEAGRLGRKSGRGFYDYTGDAPRLPADEDDGAGREIFMRVLVMLINEAADALFWNVATREDIDLAMTKGVNYPKGLLAWADDVGPGEVLRRMEALQQEYREDRYRPSPLLRRLAGSGSTFYD